MVVAAVHMLFELHSSILQVCISSLQSNLVGPIIKESWNGKMSEALECHCLVLEDCSSQVTHWLRFPRKPPKSHFWPNIGTSGKKKA